ncbi:hypothetical protein TALC_01577 [Thermoplasmatales archaeon BRNA1]|nr:hypothetical protein TALC_01577 [Thermoplasmatales archaeon BRNA1]
MKGKGYLVIASCIATIALVVLGLWAIAKFC